MRHLIILLILAFVSPVYAASCFEVSVKVDETKSNGGGWEWHGGKPDLKICIYDDWGKRCKVTGSGNNYTKAYCHNSLSCDLGVIRFTGDKVNFEIINVNRFFLDGAIEFGECEVGKECKLGNASFHFKKASCQ